MARRERILEHVTVEPGTSAGLDERDRGWAGGPDFADLSHDELKAEATAILERDVKELSQAQELLWASDTRALLVVFQAMDAAGKDSAIEHVMSGVNPQGVQVVSFKQPSPEELDQHRDFQPIALRGGRRPSRAPEWLEKQRLPGGDRGEQFWQERYEDINAFERHLHRNGTTIVKFFLHVSRAEQKRRLLARLDRPHKQWKFNAADVAERARWDEYMSAYEAALSATSPWAPWYVIPADHKWLTQALVAAILVDVIQGLSLRWPEVSDEEHKANLEARRRLEAED